MVQNRFWPMVSTVSILDIIVFLASDEVQAWEG